jgi:hypothetical protein
MATQPLPGPALVDDATPAPKQPAPKPLKPLPSDRVTTAKQLEILRAFAAVSNQGTKPVGNREVAGVINITPESISSCNAFFSSIGLIQKNDGTSWTVSAEVLAFFRAYEWNKETAANKLAPVIQSSWFSQALFPKLSFRPLTEEEAISVLGEAAVAAPEYKKSLRMILEFMDAAGIIQRDGTQVILRSGASPGSDPPKTVQQEQKPMEQNEVTPRTPKVATSFSQMAEGAMRFNISFSVDMVEMASWKADRIAAFFSGIAQVLAAKAEVEKTAKD